MGNYSKNISERIKNVRIKDGYCLICGEYGPLTMDHVPPQGAITITKIEQKQLLETLGNKKIKGVISNNGSRFKTICKNCNSNIIGKNDMEVCSVIKALNIEIQNYFSNPNFTHNEVSVSFHPVNFCRSMIGHILSATTVDECRKEPVASSYFTPLKNFVLGDDYAISDTHDIYYWYNPSEGSFSGKFLSFMELDAFMKTKHSYLFSLLSFFPISFLLIEKNKGAFPPNAKKLTFDDSKITMNLSKQPLKNYNFPLIIESNELKIVTFIDLTCTVSKKYSF